MHPDYDHLYIQFTSKEGKFQPQTNIFLGNNNPFSIKPTVNVGQDFEKSNNFPVLKFLYHKLANRK